MGGVTAAAITLGGLIALPTEIVVFIARLLSHAVFLVALLGVLYGRGRLRTFFIGGLVAALFHFVPEIVSPGRNDDAVLTELLKSLSRVEGSPIRGLPPAAIASAPVMRVVELLVSVASLGLFSVWFRTRIEKWQGRRG